MAKLGKIDLNAQDADVVDVSQPFTAESSALTVAPQNEVSLAGGAGAIQPMNPMESGEILGNRMESYGIVLNPMESYEILWNGMESHEIL